MSRKLPKIWDNAECWIIGGGWSLSEQFNVPANLIPHYDDEYLEYGRHLSLLHGKKCIGVNNAMFLGDWLTVGFFGDNSWGIQYKTRIDRFGYLKATCAPRFSNQRLYQSIFHISKNPDRILGLTTDPDKVSWNYNSGGAAINVAMHLGATRIILLGFDMMNSASNGKVHWHRGYPDKKKATLTNAQVRKGIVPPLPDDTGAPNYTRHTSGFDQIAADAKELGLEIINASPNSTLEHFPKVSVMDLL